MRRNAAKGKALVRHWRASGDTVAGYCRQNRISRQVLDYWRARVSRHKSDLGSGFIQIAGEHAISTKDCSDLSGAMIRVEMSSPRIRWTFGPGVESERIAQVVRMVLGC